MPNPGAVIGGAAIGSLTIPALIAAILELIGFGSIGPVGGTLAAAIQSGLGSVSAGSLFAILQSVAMGGAAAALPVIGALVGGAVAGVAFLG